MRVEWTMRMTGGVVQIGVADVVLDCCGKEGAEAEGKALRLPVPTLTCGHELWAMTERMRLQVKIRFLWSSDDRIWK